MNFIALAIRLFNSNMYWRDKKWDSLVTTLALFSKYLSWVHLIIFHYNSFDIQSNTQYKTPHNEKPLGVESEKWDYRKLGRNGRKITNLR